MSRKCLTKPFKDRPGYRRAATERDNIKANGGEREEEEECAPYLLKEMERWRRSGEHATTSQDAVSFCDRARELLGFNSMIPEE